MHGQLGGVHPYPGGLPQGGSRREEDRDGGDRLQVRRAGRFAFAGREPAPGRSASERLDGRFADVRIRPYVRHGHGRCVVPDDSCGLFGLHRVDARRCDALQGGARQTQDMGFLEHLRRRDFRSPARNGCAVVLCLVAAVPHAAAGKRLLRSRRAGCRRGQGRRRRERRTAHRRRRERVARTAPRADRVSGLGAVQAGNPLSLRRGADAHGGRPHAVARRHRPAD